MKSPNGSRRMGETESTSGSRRGREYNSGIGNPGQSRSARRSPFLSETHQESREQDCRHQREHHSSPAQYPTEVAGGSAQEEPARNSAGSSGLRRGCDPTESPARAPLRAPGRGELEGSIRCTSKNPSSSHTGSPLRPLGAPGSQPGGSCTLSANRPGTAERKP